MSMRKEIGITYNDPIITGKSNSDEGGTNVENDTCNICDNSCNSWDLHYIPNSNNVIEGMTNKNFNEINESFSSEKRKVFYSVKANPNLSILKILADMGASLAVVFNGLRLLGTSPASDRDHHAG